MAKLDEITELLTDELEGLKQMLVQLKTLTKELTSSETVKDISQIRYKQEELNKTQDKHFREQNTGLSEVKTGNKNGTPNSEMAPYYDIGHPDTFLVFFRLFGLSGGAI